MDFNEYEWLTAVRTHPRRTRWSWMSAHALMSWLGPDGTARVAVDVMTGETHLHKDTLRRGFEDLEECGLLTRDPLRRKPGSDEWDVRTYRAQMPPGQSAAGFRPLESRVDSPRPVSSRSNPSGSKL